METARINGKLVRLTQSPSELGLNDDILTANLEITLDIMNNCLDVIYELVKGSYPDVFRARLYLSDDLVLNAFADYENRRIIINLGLFKAAVALVERYTDSLLCRYKILEGERAEAVRSGVRVSLWRYVVLHELYHLWHGHAQWLKKYYVNEDGKISARCGDGKHKEEHTVIISEANKVKGAKVLSKTELEANITLQAIELDADSSAVCMLVNLMFFDMENRQIKKEEQKDHIKLHLAYIMAGLSTAFCLFDENAGGRFELLDKLEGFTHPIPAIRFFYAEEIADACLQNYIKEENDIRYVESEWQKIVCDTEADHNGEVDMGQVFFYPAHTEVAQRHICRLKERLADMNATMREFSVGNIADRLTQADIELSASSIWFEKNGKSLRGWINPVTARPYVVRADRMPVRVKKKIGRNERCPCGSGKKYKHCCGSVQTKNK